MSLKKQQALDSFYIKNILITEAVFMLLEY